MHLRQDWDGAVTMSRMKRTLIKRVVKTLDKERRRLEKDLHGVTAALKAFGKAYRGSSTATRPKRKMSAAARARIAQAQRARWKKWKAKQKKA